MPPTGSRSSIADPGSNRARRKRSSSASTAVARGGREQPEPGWGCRSPASSPRTGGQRHDREPLRGPGARAVISMPRSRPVAAGGDIGMRSTSFRWGASAAIGLVVAVAIALLATHWSARRSASRPSRSAPASRSHLDRLLQEAAPRSDDDRHHPRDHDHLPFGTRAGSSTGADIAERTLRWRRRKRRRLGS